MKTLVNYAMSFIGQPYIWGAEGVIGFDCSGLVQEILRSVGEDPMGDQNAQSLYAYFLKAGREIDQLETGGIVFYGHGLREITHVAFGIDNFRVIEAGGGGAACTTPVKAAQMKAMVRIRPYRHRSDMLIVLMPNYNHCKREVL
jgi:cell wall-associated NlpC family hydrolase